MKRATAILLTFILTFGSTPVNANVEFTTIVNAAYVQRTIDQNLINLATQRAIQITSDFSHNGVPAGMAEVNTWNRDGNLAAVLAWQGSPPHHAVLSDPTYSSIGCGVNVVGDGRIFFVCLLPWAAHVTVPAPEPIVVPVAEPTQAPMLPNTALDAGG